MSRRTVRSIGVAAALAVAAPAGAQAAAPKVDQLVAFKDGTAVRKTVKASKATAKVGRRRCAVPRATALAALIHSHVGPLKLRDYGSCSRKPGDAGGLYVRQIKRDRAKGVDGWVYKVAQKAASAGAGDPTGPFGRGRLKKGARVTWFYCRMKARGCQRTLVAKPEALGGGMVRVTVRGYDDRGKGKATANATVHIGDQTAETDASGVATLTVAPGPASVYAEKAGLVRSFEEAVDVR